MRYLSSIVFVVSAITVSACGDDGGSVSGVDAAGTVASVETATCTGDDPTVSTTNGVLMFTPNSVSIPVNGIVKFTMGSTHSVVPDVGSDNGLKVTMGGSACLKFTKAGSFGFHCGPHGFKGTVVVGG